MGTSPPERGEETQGVATDQVTTTRIRIKSTSKTTEHAQLELNMPPASIIQQDLRQNY
jgi:hypothetical protein